MSPPGNGTDNQTAWANSTDAGKDAKEIKFGLNVYVLLTVVIPMLMKVPGFVSLLLSTRLPIHIRYVGISFLVGILSFDSCTVILQVAVLILGFEYAAFPLLRSVLPALFIVITWSCLAHLAISRLVFVKNGANHWTLNSRLKVLWTIVVFDWVLPISLFTATFMCYYDYSIFIQPYNADVKNSKPIPNLVVICFVIYEGITIFVYVMLHRFLRNAETGSVVSNNTYSSARFLIRIIIVSLITQSPSILQTVVFNFIGLNHEWRDSVRAFTSILVVASMLLNTYLLIWKLDECQYHFIRLFMGCFDTYKKKVELLRVKVYKPNDQVQPQRNGSVNE